MAETVESLAYEQALRAADHQEATLDGLRSRAGVLVAVASLATSFFGGKTLDDASAHWSTSLAVLVFLVLLGLVLYVLWPRTWTFVITGPTVLANQRRKPAAVEVHQRFLTDWLDRYHTANQKKLNTLTKAYRYACIALGLEVGAWLLPF